MVADVDEGKRALAEELGAEWTDPERRDARRRRRAGAVRARRRARRRLGPGPALPRDRRRRQQPARLRGRSPQQLLEREILWAPDFVANAGGIINIAVELEPEGYAPERAEGRVRAIGDTLRTIFDEADAAGTTPLAAAMALANRRLAEASAPPPAASLGAPPA